MKPTTKKRISTVAKNLRKISEVRQANRSGPLSPKAISLVKRAIEDHYHQMLRIMEDNFMSTPQRKAVLRAWTTRMSKLVSE